VATHSTIGHFRSNAARLSRRYYSGQPLHMAEDGSAVEQHRLVKALNGRVAMMQADLECEYRLQCDMLRACS